MTPTGYHYHIHLLAVTKYIFFSKLRSIWTDCVRTSFQHFGIPFTTASDDLVVANCKKVYSLQNAVREVTKYITKTVSWSAIPEADLIEILTLPRFPRMFELFGEFRACEALNPCSVGKEKSVLKNYLDKNNVSDGSISPKPKPTRYTLLRDLEKLRDSIIEITNFRIKHLKFRNPQAKFTRKDRTMHASFDRVFARCGRATRTQNQFIEARRILLANLAVNSADDQMRYATFCRENRVGLNDVANQA